MVNAASSHYEADDHLAHVYQSTQIRKRTHKEKTRFRQRLTGVLCNPHVELPSIINLINFNLHCRTLSPPSPNNEKFVRGLEVQGLGVQGLEFRGACWGFAEDIGIYSGFYTALNKKLLQSETSTLNPEVQNSKSQTPKPKSLNPKPAKP